MTSYKAVADEVRAELARQRISGVRAAKALGWTQNYIQRRLSGVVPFDVADLQAIADLLEVSVTNFFPVQSPEIRKPAGFLVPRRIGQVTSPDVRRPGSCPPDLGIAA